MDIHRTDKVAGLDYKLSRNELKDALGGELESAGSQILLKKFIVSQEEHE